MYYDKTEKIEINQIDEFLSNKKNTVVSTLPQLWLIGKNGSKVDALSAHYVALVALSKAVNMIFW
jgi:hypothetical protein